MIVEMRTYRTKPGMRPGFVELFHAKTKPEHARLGMPIAGPLLSIDDPDVFFFMRGFDDVQSREPLKARFYEGQLWRNELESVLMPMLDHYQVVTVEDVEGVVRW